jgi:hypothetical protein
MPIPIRAGRVIAQDFEEGQIWSVHYPYEGKTYGVNIFGTAQEAKEHAERFKGKILGTLLSEVPVSIE